MININTLNSIYVQQQTASLKQNVIIRATQFYMHVNEVLYSVIVC